MSQTHRPFVVQADKRARKAVESLQRQEELRRASIADPLVSSGVRMPPSSHFKYSGSEVMAAVRGGEPTKVSAMCADFTSRPLDNETEEYSEPKLSQPQQPIADVNHIPQAGAGADHIQPPLHIAASQGDASMLEALLGFPCGANVNLVDPRFGYSALHLAVIGGRLPVLSALVKVGLWFLVLEHSLYRLNCPCLWIRAGWSKLRLASARWNVSPLHGCHTGFCRRRDGRHRPLWLR